MNDILKEDIQSSQNNQNQIVSPTKHALDDALGFGLRTPYNEWCSPMIKHNLEYIRPQLTQENKEKLKGKYLILLENPRWWKEYIDFIGMDDAYDILASNPKEEIILVSSIPKQSFLSNEQLSAKQNIFEFLISHPNVKVLQIPFSAQDITELDFNETTSYGENYLSLADDIAKWNILRVRHSLQGILDPYHPQNDWQQERIQRTFEEAKKYFPWLDTLDKMLDFITHVNIDIPEKMKGKRITGVYCDVDGTLIDYVGIHSGKEWTQKLRQSVVDLLKKYETEGKDIYIWTGGDVQKKAAYLKSLWITRPMVNKYDYAWATAEIVIDDTDQNTFILQSKILPETYIDTKDWE